MARHRAGGRGVSDCAGGGAVRKVGLLAWTGARVSRILVLNPNSSAAVTASMEEALAPLRAALAPQILCRTLAEGPPAIESDDDVRAVAPLVAARVAMEPAEAHVVACFSDPGVAEARARSGGPVIGIAEAGYLAALGLGARFGVISILAGSIPRHAAHVARLGLSARLAGDRAIGFGVAALSGPEARAAILATATRLRDEDGADALVLGCAGMGGHRPALEDALGLPVVDPVQAAVVQAAAILLLGYPPSARPGPGEAG